MKTDFRSKETKKLEDDFICKLRQNNQLYKLANYILFNYIKIGLNNGLTKKKIIDIISINVLYKKKKENDDYQRIKQPNFSLKNKLITKNGYDCEKKKCYKILSFKSYKELEKFNRENNISLLQITSSFYKFQMNNNLFTNLIKKKSNLQKKIVHSFNNYFMTNYNFKQIDKIVNKSEGSWFYMWLFIFLSSEVKNLMHRNSNEDKDYIRKWIFNIKKKDIVSLSQKNIACIDKQYKFPYDIMKGNTYMKPTVNGIFWNIMKNNKKDIISGFSSSAVLFYNYIFNITKILPNTKNNKVKILCLILADYYEIHHSFSEILSMYTVNAKLDKYKLENNDLYYIKKLIKKYTKLKI